MFLRPMVVVIDLIVGGLRELFTRGLLGVGTVGLRPTGPFA